MKIKDVKTAPVLDIELSPNDCEFIASVLHRVYLVTYNDAAGVPRRTALNKDEHRRLKEIARRLEMPVAGLVRAVESKGKCLCGGIHNENRAADR